MNSIVTSIDLDSDGFGISKVTITVRNPSTELMRTLVLGEPLNTGGNVTSEEAASVLSKEYYTQRVAHGTLKPQKSIFSGLSDKEALRAMADECEKRGLSIMVNMKVSDIGDSIMLKPIRIMQPYVIERNAFIGLSFDTVNPQCMILKVAGNQSDDSKADKAFAKIMKTIKEYQDRIR